MPDSKSLLCLSHSKLVSLHHRAAFGAATDDGLFPKWQSIWAATARFHVRILAVECLCLTGLTWLGMLYHTTYGVMTPNLSISTTEAAIVAVAALRLALFSFLVMFNTTAFT